MPDTMGTLSSLEEPAFCAREPTERQGCDKAVATHSVAWAEKRGEKSFWSIVFHMCFMKRVSLRAFDCALGTQKRLTTAGGTHVSVHSTRPLEARDGTRSLSVSAGAFRRVWRGLTSDERRVRIELLSSHTIIYNTPTPQLSMCTSARHRGLEHERLDIKPPRGGPRAAGLCPPSGSLVLSV